jgi:hypothetical protein
MTGMLCAPAGSKGRFHGRGAAFKREALQAILIGGERRRKNLDRDIAAEAAIPGAVNLTHTARTNGRLNFIRP